jgi:hypothetical protein
MSLILDGSNGLSDVDGSAATPAIRGTDTNTGIFFPAADTIAFSEGGVESMRIDASGILSVGTTATVNDLNVPVQLNSVSGFQRYFGANRGGSYGLLVGYDYNSDIARIRNIANTAMTFETNNTERMRIDSSGNLLVGTTVLSFTSGTGIKIAPTANVGAMCITTNTAVGATGSYHLYNTNATNNGYRFYVVSNGGIYNYSGNNSNLSDERTKKNIDLSDKYLNKICAIPVKLFNYKDEAEGEQKTLGVIAQDVEAVAPELVNNHGFGETKDGEEPLKSIYTTDMMFALMKSIQEQQVMIEELKAKVAALDTK